MYSQSVCNQKRYHTNILTTTELLTILREVIQSSAMSPEQIQKLRHDLGITQTNMTILADMLTELTPGQEHQEDRSLLEQLHGTCRAMQSRLVELINQVTNHSTVFNILTNQIPG